METAISKNEKTRLKIVEDTWNNLIKKLGMEDGLSKLLPSVLFLKDEEFAIACSSYDSEACFDSLGHVAIFRENADIGTKSHEFMHDLFNLLVPNNVKWREYEYMQKDIEFPYLRFLDESSAYLVDGYYTISLLEFLPPIKYPTLEDIVKRYFEDLEMKNMYGIGSYISFLASDVPSYLVWYLKALGRREEVFEIVKNILNEVRKIERPEDARDIYKKYIESKLEKAMKEFYLTKYEIAFEYIKWLIEKRDYKIAKARLSEIEQWYPNNEDEMVRKIYREKIRPQLEKLKRQILYKLSTEKARI